MRITEAIQHDAPASEVYAMLCDSRYQELRCERSGALEHEVTVELQEGSTLVVTRRRMATDRFPDFARSIVGDTVDVIESQSWGEPDSDGSRGAGVELSIPGTPVEFTGSLSLAPVDGDPARTEHTLTGDLQAHVPLLGSRIEKAVAPIISGAFRQETQVAQEWRTRA
ncbi:DUF2505 domain-containing protein [Ornithinicoccus halotolerans]|uniref:DUF2505 domain-containing protein n=1 Tax=Ornithinicoccus halotolerans TaxID=1748220 RepID=UPI001295E29E|nr:DUF2505 domain-containing protein [Ornithinicoccus halotolerans]